jgi:transposase InsO family protein
VFKEISKMEQRYDAVLMVIRDGFRVSEVAVKFKVSRQTLYKWMADYEAGGLEGLKDRSHRPQHVPHQIDGGREAAIIRLRLSHPFWGPVSIAHQMTREGLKPPSLMTIHRVLSRKGLIVATRERKKLPTYKRWERGRPMELWQMDVVGGVLTEAGVEAKILTGIDDHSRFIVCAGVMARATLRPVCAHLVSALERYGVPEEILTDIQGLHESLRQDRLRDAL